MGMVLAAYYGMPSPKPCVLLVNHVRRTTLRSSLHTGIYKPHPKQKCNREVPCRTSCDLVQHNFKNKPWICWILTCYRSREAFGSKSRVASTHGGKKFIGMVELSTFGGCWALREVDANNTALYCSPLRVGVALVVHDRNPSSPAHCLRKLARLRIIFPSSILSPFYFSDNETDDYPQEKKRRYLIWPGVKFADP